MKTLHKRCAGLDVHKVEVVACLRLISKRKVEREVRRFPTTTQGLLALAKWLEGAGCTHVAMEATGVYWKPVWHILEGRFALILANAAHVKNVPGRKSDVNDANWLADLLAHGLIRSSFVPPPAIQELRDLTRTRKQLTREIVRHVQRIGGSGGGERQTVFGDHGHHGRQRAAHVEGHDRRRDGCRKACRAGP
jgi:transposase